MIKTVLKSIFALIIIIGTMFFIAYNETHYSKMGTITQDGMLSTFEDYHGNQYREIL